MLIICVPLFIKLGLWQYNKARLKQEVQTSYNASLDYDALTLPAKLENLDAWKYKKIKVTGHYIKYCSTTRLNKAAQAFMC